MATFTKTAVLLALALAGYYAPSLLTVALH